MSSAAAHPELALTGKPPSGRETAIAASLLLLVLAIPGFLFRSAVLWRHPLWLDEMHTVLVSQQRGLGAVLSSLAHGADFNPPLLFVWHWAIGRVLGVVSPEALRLTALVSVWLAIVLLYLFLRRSFAVVPSLLGALVVAGQGLVLTEAYEGRFYGPWMLLVMIYIGSLSRAVERPASRAAQVGACASAVLLCLIHYFGAITLGLVVLGIGATRLRPWRQLLVLVPSTGAAALTMAAMIPMYLGQKAALSVATWVDPPTLETTLDFIQASIVPLSLALLLLLAAWSALAPRANDGPSSAAATDPRIYGLLSLALLPLFLIAFSVTVQSVMVSRYAVPASLALGPAAAFAATGMRGWLRMAGVAGVVLLGLAAGRQVTKGWVAFTGRVRDDSVAVSRILAAGGTIAVTRRFELYPLLHDFPEQRDRLVMATAPASLVQARFPRGSDSAMTGDMVRLEQDVAAVHARFFGVPRMLPPDSLARVACLFLLEGSPQPAYAARWMPEARFDRVRTRLYRLASSPAGADPYRCGPS